MEKTLNSLTPLGWSDWFAARAACHPDETLARVAAVDRELLLLLDPSGPFRAKLAGRYRHHHLPSEERPCVGDWVCVAKEQGADVGVVQALLERRTSLQRKAAGAGGAVQMIAANIDTVVIVQACHVDFNLKRLERYLVMVLEGGAEPLILLSKTDLVPPEMLTGQIEQIRAAGIAAPLLTLSNVSSVGVAELQRQLQPGKTYCFVGSSGVGKSTLINRLLGRDRQETGAVSGSGEGRHTTVRRELLTLESGALVIDNPGMREFGLIDAEEGFGSRHADIVALAAACRYRDCSHAGEPGCAVQAALVAGELSAEHFESYRKLSSEAAFHRLSSVEKRRKDRDFGRFLKTAKKDWRDD